MTQKRFSAGTYKLYKNKKANILLFSIFYSFKFSRYFFIFSQCVFWSSISDQVPKFVLPSGLLQRRLQRRMCLDPCQKQRRAGHESRFGCGCCRDQPTQNSEVLKVCWHPEASCGAVYVCHFAVSTSASLPVFCFSSFLLFFCAERKFFLFFHLFRISFH